MKIIPVVLCGGSGTRLWPVSRQDRPKQFLNQSGNYSLFQQTLLRCKAECFDPMPVIVGAYDHRYLIAQQMAEIDCFGDVLLEPVSRNSCPAIAAACFKAMERRKDAVALIVAADHKIDDNDAFVESVLAGRKLALKNNLVTFGVKPTHADTGYGYIEPGLKLGNGFKINNFSEKPDQATAELYFQEGRLWNSGNFLFKASAFLDDLKTLGPDIHDSVEQAFAFRNSEPPFEKLDTEYFSMTSEISVDYAVMERTPNSVVIPVGFGWSDVGNWDKSSHGGFHDNDHNTVFGDVATIDSHGNMIHSDKRLTALIGIDDTIVVTTEDAILIAKRERAEDVKLLVESLKKKGRQEIKTSLRQIQPWGDFQQLDVDNTYKVKRLTVLPGAELSLQKHMHRSEHWIVVCGTAEVTLDCEVRILQTNESFYVPVQAVHRIANRHNTPLVLIEVQTGNYFGEDDITRIEDRYKRETI